MGAATDPNHESAPRPPAGFLCDRMLIRVGKWLRAAGHDTIIAGAADTDRDLVTRARREGRLLLTCDRRIEREHAGTEGVVLLLATSAPEPAALELRTRIGIDWQHAPFTRCLEDNGPLRAARAGERRRAPVEALDLGGPVLACDHCGRIYWPGSHVRRMRGRLARFAGGHASAGPRAGT